MTMNYFYKSQAEQYTFIRIPKALVTGENFSTLSITAKILYGLLLDRMAMSVKNNWIDNEGRVYIYYQLSEIQDDMNVSKRKAIDCMGELEDIGLIQKNRQGSGLPNQIYVRNFVEGGTVREKSEVQKLHF
ncbi:MAG: replication initiator protein A [Lachnospiraceae bacterium]|nr:replication initiator protein A [Lachnospiraceae bacterium]